MSMWVCDALARARVSVPTICMASPAAAVAGRQRRPLASGEFARRARLAAKQI